MINGKLWRPLFDRTSDTHDRTDVELLQPIAHRLVAELAPRSGERSRDVEVARFTLGRR